MDSIVIEVFHREGEDGDWEYNLFKNFEDAEACFSLDGGIVDGGTLENAIDVAVSTAKDYIKTHKKL